MASRDSPMPFHAAYPDCQVQPALCTWFKLALRYVSTEDSKSSGEGSQENLSIGNGGQAEASLERIRSSLGRQVSDDFKDVACQVDGYHHVV
ncbi:MAG: hypothetical protein KF851_14035 [Pirellulaceae bacterium]|nr:hypothetical protein [Pirellulaceae bacterium]